MTELEKIEYAKSFIDKLANGINPIDGSEIPDSDVVSNVRLSRCFFFVSDILRQVIENGGVKPEEQIKEKKPRRLPYTLTPEQAQSFEFSDSPISLTEIINRIIAIGPVGGVRKFPKSKLTKWLFYLGLIEERYVGEVKVRRPTPKGEEMGIFTEERQGLYGSYFATLYSLDAQHFIIDNIEAIINFDLEEYREKMNLDNQGKRWLREHDEQLMQMFKSGRTVSEMARALKRGNKAIIIRLKIMGIDPNTLI